MEVGLLDLAVHQRDLLPLVVSLAKSRSAVKSSRWQHTRSGCLVVKLDRFFLL
jgi:hypothetical protein